MNNNENQNNNRLDSDIEHLKDIERIIESRSASKDGAKAPEKRRYLRNVPKEDNPTVKKAEEKKTNPEAEEVKIARPTAAEKKPAEVKKAPIAAKPQNTQQADSGDTILVDKVKTAPAKPQQTKTNEAKQTVESSRHPAVTKKDDGPVYNPLMTENDDFELDENPEPDDVEVKGTIGAFTSVAKAIAYLIAVFAVSVFLAVTFINIANDVFAFVKEDKEITVVVPENCTTEQLAKLLGESGAIKYPTVFEFYADFKSLSIEKTKADDSYVAGTHTVSPTLNYDYMISEFKPKAPERKQVVITIPEGYSVDQMVKLLVEKGLGTYEGYVRAINEYDGYDYRFIDELEVSDDRFWRLEGYLYPDTYYYYSTSTEETVIYKMLENFNNKFTEEYYERAKEMNMTVDEIITLASMIQKEVKYADEFGNVSSVFHNRLNNPANFPYLDSDATIIYAIERDTGERPQTLKETSYDSPYNTYKNRGLPPGPIANPSMEAIRYAMYPNKTSYYFFVTNSQGRTTFSRTYTEHLAAIAELKK